MTHPHPDAFDEALTDEPMYFAGKARTDAWNCVLEKGRGKVPYDAEQHKGQRKSVAIEITIEPLDPTRQLIQRDMLNWTADFKRVVRPSIEALAEKIAKIRSMTVGQFNPLREVSDLWVVGEFVPRPDNKPDQTWTTIKFMDVFATEAECKARHDKLVVSGEGEDVQPQPAAATTNAARASMAAFLPALWEQAGKDPDKFAALIASNPMLATHFTLESPEVQKLVAPI